MNAATKLSLIGLFGCSSLASALRAQVPAGLANEKPAPFVENRGQWPDEIRFCARAEGWRAAVEDRGWRLALPGSADESAVVRTRVQGSGSDAPLGVEAADALHHFFSGERSGVGARSFASVRYLELVPGVDLQLRCEAGHLEYDLELTPRADLSLLVFEVEGACVREIAADGSLTLETPLGELLQPPPRAFSIDAAGAARDFEIAFVRIDDSRFGFELREELGDLRLVIDPSLIWSTYIGGNATQTVRAIADLNGRRSVIAGSTEAFDFPITAGVFDPNHNGSVDAFVTELDGSGRILWSTFLGGLGMDAASAIAVDALGVVTIAGNTRSQDLPATVGAFDTTWAGFTDGFVARLSSDGSRLSWCTYLGGSKNDELHALALGPAGDPTVGGWTLSTNYPVTFGAYGRLLSPGSTSDGCVTRLAADGRSLLASSYFGGNYVDSIEALALTPSRILVAGATQSANFPCTIGAPFGGEDGFVSSFDESMAQLVMSTALGGAGSDSVRGLAVDAFGQIFVAGKTDSLDLPVSAGAFGLTNVGLDGFMMHLDPLGAIVGCTYLGGTGSDEILALARTKSGELFATGWTDSPDFPTTPGAFDRLLNINASSSGGDAFVIRASEDLGKLSYSTFFGAGDDDRGWAIAAIDNDTVLVAGETNSYFFPTTPGAHRTSRGVLATLEGFASRLDLLKNPVGFGTGKQSSFGSFPTLRWTGFPSLADQNFQFVVHSAVPYQTALVFIGPSRWNQPFLGGTLYVSPPLQRIGTMDLDFVGYGELPYSFAPAMIGTTFVAQALFTDPWDSLRMGLTSGLEIFVYP